MKALLRLKSAINQSSILAIAALITIAPLLNPALVAKAAEFQTSATNPALVFEINSQSDLQNQNSLSYNQITAQDPLVIALKAYLEKHGSPLAEYADEIPTYPQWQRALAISWVESNFGKYCYTNNCSGIGVAPGHPLWRTYKTKLDWFADLSNLLEKPIYKEKYTTCKLMKGIYVYPGSANWVRGCEQKLNELNELTKTADEQKVAMQDRILVALYGTPVNGKIE